MLPFLWEPTLWSSSVKKWDHTIRQYTSSHAATHRGCNLKARTAMLLLGKVVYEQEDSNEGCHHGCHPAAWFCLENLSSYSEKKTGYWREQLIYRCGNAHHLELVHCSGKKSSRSIHIITLNRKLMYQGFIDNNIVCCRKETSTILSSIRLWFSTSSCISPVNWTYNRFSKRLVQSQYTQHSMMQQSSKWYQ